LSAQVLNRHQDNLDLLFIDGSRLQPKWFWTRKTKHMWMLQITWLLKIIVLWTSEKMVLIISTYMIKRKA
jgi:dipeptidyl-peptidase-4